MISRESRARVKRPASDGFPPCIVGKASSLEAHERVELISLVLLKENDAPLRTLSNTVLIDALCRSRAIFSITLDGNRTFHVECLVPLSRVYTEYRTCESIIVQAVDSGSAPYQFANLHIAFIRDSLLANDTETLGLACIRPPWHVAKDDLRLWFNLSNQPAVRSTQWQLIRGQNTGQLSIGGLSQRVSLKRGLPVSMPPAVLHPWQAAPPLPSLIEIDLSNHYPQHLPSPDLWRISQRNARVLISDPRDRVVGLDV